MLQGGFFMFRSSYAWLGLSCWLVLGLQSTLAQNPQAVPATGVVQTSATSAGNAAIVNGEVIPDAAVQRELRFAAPVDVPKLRPAIVNNLVDLLLIDQYLRAAKVDAPASEIDARLKK